MTNAIDASIHFHKWPLPHSQVGHFQCLKRKSKTTFSIQIYPQFVGEMVTETNGGHSKVAFLPLYLKKCLFSKSPRLPIFS